MFFEALQQSLRDSLNQTRAAVKPLHHAFDIGIRCFVVVQQVRSQGALVMNDLRRALAEMRDPTAPLAHGAMILFAGALLLTPGFFTDACGLALLIPPVREAVMRAVAKRVQVQSFTMGTGFETRQSPPPGPGVIDGDFIELDPQNLPPRGNSGWTRH